MKTKSEKGEKKLHSKLKCVHLDIAYLFNLFSEMMLFLMELLLNVFFFLVKKPRRD